MKTPRDILLTRHQAATPKLDALRRAVLAEEFSAPESKKQKSGMVALLLGCIQVPWRELVLPSRRVWTGLATMWILIFLVNFSLRDNVSSVTGQPVRTAPVVMSWQVQQRLMNQVLADRVLVPDIDRPRTVTPRPRTEHDHTCFV
jgi:hypothetical protein